MNDKPFAGGAETPPLDNNVLSMVPQLGRDRLIWNAVEHLNERYAWLEEDKVIFDMEHFCERSVKQVQFDTAHYHTGVRTKTGIELRAFAFWEVSHLRRQYKGRKFVPGGTIPTCRVDPTGKDLGGEYVNLWRGYGCEPKKGDVRPLQALIYSLCAGDQVEINFMTMRIAIKLQKLWLKIPTFTAIVTFAEGTGKSQLGKFIAGLHGEHGKMVTDAQVEASFHDWCKQGLTFAVCEEVNLKDRRGAANRLKAMVSMENQFINPKGKAGYYVDNYMDLFFTANEHDALYIRTEKERRSFVAYHPRVSPLSTAQSKALQLWYDQGGKEAMLHYFLHEVKTDNFDPYAAAPTTSGKQLMAEASRTPAEIFISEQISDAARPLYSFPDLAAKFAGIDLDRRIEKILSQALAKAECPHRRPRVRAGGGAQGRLTLYALVDMEKWAHEPEPSWATQWEAQYAAEQASLKR